MLFFYYMYVACNSGVCLRNILSIIWKVTWWSVQFLYIKSSPVIEHCFWWPEHLSGSNYIYRDVVSIGPLQIPSLHTLNGKIIMCKDDKLYPKKSWNHTNSAMYPCNYVKASCFRFCNPSKKHVLHLAVW